MRNTAFALLLSLLLAMAQDAPAQTRPRRVEHPRPNTSSSTSTSADAQLPPAKNIGEEVGEDEVVSVNTNLVTVPVSITDRDGRYIADLQKEDFHIYEDGVEQTVAYFATVEKPFTVVLMLDTSASTWSKLGQIKDAAETFVEQLRPDDQVMVATFASGFTVKCEPTTDRQKIRKAIQSTGKGLSTHLYDAMEKLMEKHLDRIQGRKAVVLFTDGVDATSHHATYESTARTAEELDALIYPIRFDTYDPSSDRGGSRVPQTSPRLPSILRRIPLPTIGTGGSGGSSNGSSRADYDRGERYLNELAELTGGRLYQASRDLRYLRDAFSHIAEELRRQYSLGYYSNQPAQAGERRRIRVRVNRSDLAVRARDSYIYKSSTVVSGTSPTAANEKEWQPSSTPLPRLNMD